MSPENTHKPMGLYMEFLILSALYFSTWFLLLLADSYGLIKAAETM